MAARTLLLALLLLQVSLSYSAEPKSDEYVKSHSLAKPEKQSETKVNQLPTPETDKENQRILTNLLKNAGWFPNLTIKTEEGLVVIEGTVKDKNQLDWLVTTADRLPAVIAVINKANVEETVATDLGPFKEELNNWGNRIMKALPGIIAALVLMVLFYFILRFLRIFSHRLWSYRIQNPFLLSTVAKLTLLPIYLIMFYLILLTMGLQGLATTIIGGTGVLGLVLGLAFKDIAENYFSGILLAVRSPFTKGDSIQVGNIKGIVQNLNMRGTTLMDPDGTLILIPNSTVVQSIVQNTSANPHTRTSFKIGIGFENSIAEAQKILLGVLEKSDRVLKEPKPLVLVDELGSSTVNFMVYFWFDAREASLVGMRSRVISACKDALMAAGISIPDDNREVIFKDPLQISMIKKTESEGKDKPVVPPTPKPSEGKELSESHDQMMQGSSADDELKKIAANATLPGNAQSPDLLKK